MGACCIKRVGERGVYDFSEDTAKALLEYETRMRVVPKRQTHSYAHYTFLHMFTPYQFLTGQAQSLDNNEPEFLDMSSPAPPSL